MAQSGMILTDQGVPTFESCLQRLDEGNLSFKSRLQKRLLTLADTFREDYDGRSLSTSSLAALIEFLGTGKTLRYPDITATPTGEIYAEWRDPDGRSLSVELLGSGDVRYLVFGPNPKHPQHTDRMSGITTADALPEALAQVAHAA